MTMKTAFTVRCYNAEVLRERVKKAANKSDYESSNLFILAAIDSALNKYEESKEDETSTN